MKKSLQAKLKKYGTMAAATVGTVAAADAQIVYTDVVPDSTFCNDGDEYNLDLNNDNTPDFKINVFQTSSSDSYYQTYSFWSSYSTFKNRIRINPQGGSNSFVTSSGYPAALSSGYVINNSGAWSNVSMNLGYYYFSFYSYSTWNQTGTNPSSGTWSFVTSDSNTYSDGNFLGATDKYLGLRFMVGVNTHYGWARLDMDSDARCFTIKDYAYETQPNTPIVAGDDGLTTSISELNLIQDVTVYAANNVLNVKVPAEVVGYNIKLVDVMGREIVNQKIAKSSSTIDVANQAKGVYIVLIEGEGKAFAEKITIN